MDLALGLYGLVEDEVHRLVAKSNSRLEHLQFLLKVRQLEAEFHKVGKPPPPPAMVLRVVSAHPLPRAWRRARVSGFNGK